MLGIHRSPVNSPQKGQWRGALIFSLICAWISNGSVNDRDTGDTETSCSLWRFRRFMMTSSNGNIFRVTGPLCGEFTGPGEFPTQRPVTRSFDVFFDLRLNKPLSKQSWGWWFETLLRSLWRHRNVFGMMPAGPQIKSEYRIPAVAFQFRCYLITSDLQDTVAYLWMICRLHDWLPLLCLYWQHKTDNTQQKLRLRDDNMWPILSKNLH